MISAKHLLPLTVASLLCGACDRFFSSGPSGELTQVIASDPGELDCFAPAHGASAELCPLIFESLTTRDPDTHERQPLLAKAWNVLEDGKVFEFTLDERARWPDGKAVTSQDVAFSFAALKARGAWPWTDIDPVVQVQSEQVFRVRALKAHFKLFDAVASQWIFPSHLLAAPNAKAAVGSGPLAWGSREPGKRVELTGRKDYWGRALEHRKSYLPRKSYVFTVTADPRQAVELLKEAKLSFFEWPLDLWKRHENEPKLKKNYESFALQNKEFRPYTFIGWNLNHALFRSPDVRTALALLLRRREMNEVLYEGRAREALGPVSVDDPWAPTDAKLLEHDPARAAQLLQKAGWHKGPAGLLIKDGRVFRFTIKHAGGAELEQLLEIYQRDLREAGIDLTWRRVEWARFHSELERHDFDAFLSAWTREGAPDLEPVWHSRNAVKGLNFVSYQNPKVDELLDRAQKTFDEGARKPIVREAVALIVADQPYAFLFENPARFVSVRKGVNKTRGGRTYTLGNEYW